MEKSSNLLKIKRRIGVYVLAMLALLASLFSFRKDLLGKTNLRPAISRKAPLKKSLEAESAPDAAHVAPLDPTLIEAALRNPREIQPLPPAYIDSETLWLARVIYSETKRVEEQELVAWVVRNRLETAYRGQRTYVGVALDPYQFSAFNPGSRKQRYYSNLDVDSKARGWQKALALAYYVRYAPASLRPFPLETRHFYSERSMPQNLLHPEWTQGLEPITPWRPHKLDAQRFRFYTGVM